jgi:hypothetical protein
MAGSVARLVNPRRSKTGLVLAKVKKRGKKSRSYCPG